MADAKETSKARPSRREPTTPDDYPVVPPTGRLAAIDHSFLLQSIMEVQGSIGKLTEAVTGLKEQSKDHGQKIERLSLTVYAATAVVTVLGGIGVFILNKIWDIALAYMKLH